MAHLSEHGLRQFDDAYLGRSSRLGRFGALAKPRTRLRTPHDERAEASQPPATSRRRSSGRPLGLRPGAKGCSRPQALPVDVERAHAPTCCAGCDRALTDAHPSRAHNVRHELDLVQPGPGAGLVLQQTKHLP